MTAALFILCAAVFGAVWRYVDGRGYGPSALRLALSITAAFLIIQDSGAATYTFPMAVLWGVIWLPRQKQREEFDDMLLRWAAPITAFGCLLVVMTGSLLPLPAMTLAGLLVAYLVYVGATRPGFSLSGIDSAALTETMAGATAFGGLALSIS